VSRVFVIAEAGVNHNGDMGMARRLVEVAAESGADAVKFQTFKAAGLVSKSARKAEYQQRETGSSESQYEMLKRLELDAEAHAELKAACDRCGIRFMSTPFDDGSIDLLVSMGMDIFKIPSGEITNLPYLRRIGGLGRRVILSTGMSTLAEVGDALQVLQAAGTPLRDITVLHATTEYPAPMAEVNLRAMLSLAREFGVAVGYSDHTPGIEIPVAAVALGACVIEKHFTLDRSLPGPDHKASLEPGELKAMVSAIRNVEAALGDGIKRPTPSEIKNMAVARKSLVASRDIRKGEPFGPSNMAAKRPGTGESPMRWDEFAGRPAPRDFREEEPLCL
jgi:N,N'-diacetyllegionaminate synthase